MSTPEPEGVKWDEIAKLLVDSKGTNTNVSVDLESAAKGQLESAILLWFLEADIVSIHALSCSAWEITHTVGRKIGKLSANRTLIDKTWSAAYETRPMQKTSKRGGFREGAGRKPEGKKKYTLTLTEETAEKAKERESNFSGLIDRLLARWLKRQT